MDTNIARFRDSIALDEARIKIIGIVERLDDLMLDSDLTVAEYRDLAQERDLWRILDGMLTK
jgi:hypothetical protein